MDIEQIVKRYIDVKTAYDELYKEVEISKNAVKTAFDEFDIDEYTTENNITVKLSKRNADKLNESSLIATLKTLSIPSQTYSEIVKTKEYIDDEGLENAIYNHLISSEIINDCIEKKEPIVSLRINKKRGNKK